MKEVIKKLFCLISILFIFFAGYCQTNDRKAILYCNKGCYEVFRKNYKEAIAEFSRAIKLDSNFIQAYENRGVAKFYLSDYKGAIDDYNKALEINPDDYNTYGRRGWAKFCLQDCRGAIADFTNAIEGCLDPAQYYNIRGQAKYYLQDYAGAIADFNKVIRFWSGEKDQRSKAFFWRGLVKFDIGQKDSGCLDLSKAGKLGYAKAYEIMGIYCQ
jgi:tetratricopeptide (TPR) repeat protein